MKKFINKREGGGGSEVDVSLVKMSANDEELVGQLAGLSLGLEIEILAVNRSCSLAIIVFIGVSHRTELTARTF